MANRREDYKAIKIDGKKLLGVLAAKAGATAVMFIPGDCCPVR